MAKKKKFSEPQERRAAADYYRLNLKAVDDLVNADVSNSPKVSEAELRKYRSGPKIRLSEWAKALLIKCWFNGATCFFFLWGLGVYLPNPLDQLVILGLALGAVTDLMTNSVFRFYAKTRGANDRFMMFPKPTLAMLPLNILYAFLLLACVVGTYNGLNALLIALHGLSADSVPLGVEPILFGVLITLWDALFIKIKYTAQSILRDARESATRGG